MANTKKRITLALTKGDIQAMEDLKRHYGEDVSTIYRRAIMLFHYVSFLPKFNFIDQMAETALKSQSNTTAP